MLRDIVDALTVASYYQKADTVNFEGFLAFTRKSIERLVEILFLGHTGNTFYVNSTKRLLRNVEDLDQAISILSPDLVASLIVRARKEGFFRHTPIIALILLKRYSPEHFKKIFPEVILTGQDLGDYLTLSAVLSKGYSKVKWGRAAKTAIRKWLRDRATPFTVLKYRRHIANAIAVSRPKIRDFPNWAELSYAHAVRRKKCVDMEVVLSQSPQLFHAEAFKRLVREGKVQEALREAELGRLPADLIITLLGKNTSPEIWRTIAQNMGTMQFLKYLNKLSSVLAPEELFPLIQEKIVVERLQEARVFPYSVFVAWEKVQDAQIKKYLQGVLEDYIQAYDWRKWQQYSFFIAPDVSGSVTSQWRTSPVAAMVEGFFASIIAKVCHEDTIYLWDTKVYPYAVVGKSIAEICQTITNWNGGGTMMGVPVRYATHHRILRDIFLILTDSQHWFGAYSGSFMKWWARYKNKVNPEARAVILEIVGYGNSQVDEDFANQFHVYTVFGWSECIFPWIEEKVLSASTDPAGISGAVSW